MKVRLVNENFQEDYVRNLLRARGIENPEDYICPTADYLEPPDHLSNIDAAAQVYLEVVKKNEAKIMLVVDSDCDGYCSAGIIYQYTKKLNPKITIDFLCHERKAHGLEDLIDSIMASETHYDLVILPDSSTNDYEYHERLGTIGAKCLVCDHHEKDENTPFSLNAVIVNNQLSPNYLNKALSGSGVTWQFCRYIDKILGLNWAYNYIDLAAMGNVGDMCSLAAMENRYLNYAAFTKEHLKNPLLCALLEKQAYSITGQKDANWEEVCGATNAMSIAFYIVPLINGLIRMGSMEEKISMFEALINGERLVESQKRGERGTEVRLAEEMARICSNARARQKKVQDSALFNIEVKIANYNLLKNKILFVRLDDDDDFPPELNGLIANYLAQKYKHPTIVARKGADGVDRGSGRGLNQSALDDFKGFLTESGFFNFAEGHAQSFGMSINDNKLSLFHEYANEKLSDIDFGENYYDVNFARKAFAADLRDLIARLAEAGDLWGQQNPTPMISITSLRVNPSEARIMGAKRDTVKIEGNGVAFMFFKSPELVAEIESRKEPFQFDIVGTANLNNWNGQITPQIFVKDYELRTYNPIIEF